MAKDASFDIVSELDLQEVDNALNQSRRETSTRYDLKSAGCDIRFDNDSLEIIMTADNEMALRGMVDVISGKLIKRGIDAKALNLGEQEPAAGGKVKRTGRLSKGIPVETGREINKLLKQAKKKINVQIQGDQVRVSGKNRDDLQEAIRIVKERDFGIPLQFRNYR